MDSKGAVLIGTFHGMELTERLNRAGIPAAVIGRVSKGPERILYNQEIKRYIEKSVKRRKKHERSNFNISGKKLAGSIFRNWR